MCALTFAWDFKLGFDETKYYTAAAVALYTAINGVLTFWIWAVENGIVYVGFNKNGDKIEVSTSTKRHTPIYKVVAKTYPKAGGDPTTITVIKPFSQWFDAAGRFVAQPFQAMLATKVPIISKADPKRAEPVVATKTVEDDTVTNDRWAGLLASSSGMDALTAAASTSGADSKGAKKRSKKA